LTRQRKRVADNACRKPLNLVRISGFAPEKIAPKLGAIAIATSPFSALRNPLLKNNIANSLKNLKNQLILFKK